MIIMIDNFDSFTYNLVQYVMELDFAIEVYRNNEITIPEIKDKKPTHIIISPGPGRPDNAGISLNIIEELKDYYPILGVCLGHQAIGQAFGGKIISAKRIMHGKLSSIAHKQTDVFKNLPSPFKATRYHSLAIERESCPNDLKITAESEDGEIMGIAHKKYKIYGVQFHPESILSEHGHIILQNFLDIK